MHFYIIINVITDNDDNNNSYHYIVIYSYIVILELWPISDIKKIYEFWGSRSLRSLAHIKKLIDLHYALL